MRRADRIDRQDRRHHRYPGVDRTAVTGGPGQWHPRRAPRRRRPHRRSPRRPPLRTPRPRHPRRAPPSQHSARRKTPALPARAFFRPRTTSGPTPEMHRKRRKERKNSHRRQYARSLSRRAWRCPTTKGDSCASRAKHSQTPPRGDCSSRNFPVSKNGSPRCSGRRVDHENRATSTRTAQCT